MSKSWMLSALIGLAGVAQAAPLSFTAALDLAEQQSPNLSAQDARVEGARSTAISADALPDPKLFVGIENFDVSGPDQGSWNRDFMTMEKIGVMQDVPNADKRRARAEIAAANIDLSLADRRVELLKVRSDVAQAWINRYYVERRLAIFDDLDRENGLLLDAVKAQLAGGHGQAADIVIPKQEAAVLADRRDDLTRDLAKSKADLRRLIGTEADEPLSGDPPALPVDVDAYRHHVHHHPELEAFGPATRVAEGEVHEAEAMKKSDVGVELVFQRRNPVYGNLVSVQLTYDLPLFTKTRQDPEIAVKLQNIAQIDAERTTMLREHTTELEGELADYAAVSHQLDRAKQVWLPLAQEKVDLQNAGYRAYKSDLMALLAARRELIDQRLKLIDLESQQMMLAAKLYFSYGEGAQ